MIHIIGKGMVTAALLDLIKQPYEITTRTNFNTLPQRVKAGDIIVNAATTELNEQLIELALSKRAHYVDMGSDMKAGYCEQLLYATQFKEKQLKAVINAGLAPGLTNVLAREAFDQGIEELKLFYLERAGPTPVFLWSPKIATADYLSTPVVWNRGSGVNYVKREVVKYAFPGFGVVDTKTFLHDEVASLGITLNPKHVSVHIGGDIEAKETFKEEMWGKEVQWMTFTAVIHNFNRYIHIDYEVLRNNGIKHNVIAYGTALFVYNVLQVLEQLEHGMYAPEQLPVDVRESITQQFKAFIIHS
jgi:hypothetical protein